MTPEEMAALIEALTPKLSEITNAAITSHTKRLQKDFDSKLAEFKVEPPAKETPAPETSAKSGKSSPELAAMETKLADALSRIQEAEQRRQAAEDRARDNAAFGKLKELLGKSGVRPDMVDIAAERLFHIQKRVSYDESGEPLFKIKKAPAPGMNEEDVELTFDSGVEHWLKSKDASPFVAAPAAGGPGGRGGKSPLGVPSGRSPNGMPKYDAPAATDDEKVARAAEAERALAKAIETAGF